MGFASAASRRMEQLQARQAGERRQVVRHKSIAQAGCKRDNHVGSDEFDLSAEPGLRTTGVDVWSLCFAEMAHGQVCDGRLFRAEQPDEVGEEAVI